MSTQGHEEQFHEGFVVEGVPQREEKDWGAQILLAVSLAGLLGGSLVAYIIWSDTTPFIVALSIAVASGITASATFVWAVCTWD